MAESEPQTRIRMPWVQRWRERTRPSMGDRLSSLATVVVACVGLALSSGCDACDAVKSEGLTRREYRRVLVEELCAPGEFYSECWWMGSVYCHEEIPRFVADCIPSESERVHPSEALRKETLDCLFQFHVVFVSLVMSIEEREECVDAKRWKHVPPGSEDAMRSFREGWSRKKVSNPQYVPADPDTVPDTAPEPSPGTAPEPLPDTVPDQAPAP